MPKTTAMTKPQIPVPKIKTIARIDKIVYIKVLHSCVP
jgi:hypothetical protein